jgi:chromosome segregation ATPase
MADCSSSDAPMASVAASLHDFRAMLGEAQKELVSVLLVNDGLEDEIAAHREHVKRAHADLRQQLASNFERGAAVRVARAKGDLREHAVRQMADEARARGEALRREEEQGERERAAFLSSPEVVQQRLATFAAQHVAEIGKELVSLARDGARAEEQLAQLGKKRQARAKLLAAQRKRLAGSRAQLAQLREERAAAQSEAKAKERRLHVLLAEQASLERELPAVVAERRAVDDAFRALDCKNRQLLQRIEQLHRQCPARYRVAPAHWLPPQATTARRSSGRSAFEMLAAAAASE